MKYKEQRNTRTGETRWVPIEGSENFVDKINKVPLLSSITAPVSKVISGAMAGGELNKNLGTVSESTMNQQRIAREFAQMAQREADPIRKKKLLDQSRMLSQGATSQLEGYVNPVMESMPLDYRQGESPSGAGGILKTYGVDALKAGLAVGSAYSIPSQVKSTVKLVKGGRNLIKKGVTKVTGKNSSMVEAEKVRKFVQKINPQVKSTDPNYLKKKDAIVEFSKKFVKTGKESADDILTEASKKRDTNQKLIETIFKKTKKATDSVKLDKKVIEGLKEVELDPKNPAVKKALDNVDRMLSKVIDESGKISPTKLYKVYGELGNKAFGSGGVREVKPLYQKMYNILGKELNDLSPQARKLIAENSKIRELLPGLIKTSEKISKTSEVGRTIKKVSGVGRSAGNLLGLYGLYKLLTRK